MGRSCHEKDNFILLGSPGSVFYSFYAFAAKEVKVEVLYMNHGPLQASLEQIKKVFSQYGSKITVSWYDFESKEGEQFMAKKGVTQHVPLVIWLDGKFAHSGKRQRDKVCRLSHRFGPCLFPGEMDYGRSPKRSRSNNKQKVRIS